jgi:methyl-accepting chemotaxis protein
MDMPHTHLATYLSDHLAGAAAALEILETLEKRPDAPELNRFAAELGKAIAEDRDELAQLMRRAGLTVSSVRRAAGWISEKAAELKVHIDDPLDGSLRTFELIEIVAQGIDGKRALWAALAKIATGMPQLQADYPRLSQRADSQRQAIEDRRLQWATAALTRTSS